MRSETDFTLTCPIPISEYPNILLAHGGGGSLMHRLIESMFVKTFDNPALSARHDSAVFEVGGGTLAMTTDSYVVSPIFFPGGDIGSLAVHGTVNDLAMSGARPLYLSAGFILEEGLPMEALWRIVSSMKLAADDAGVQIITGDTKVVERGKGDGVFINTAGVGVIEHDRVIAPSCVQPGDVLIINGDIARHGMAVMAVREGLSFESVIESDSAPLAELVLTLIDAGIEVHCLRDLTRGGLAGALCEIAGVSGCAVEIDEARVPVSDGVHALCEVLGFDPLYVANEGRLVAYVAGSDADKALRLMKDDTHGRGAAVIGRVLDEKSGVVNVVSPIGAKRILTMLSGEQLPRIC